MIGIIVTGHGHFASGITSSIELICGKQEKYVAIDFDGEGTEKLENDLRNAFEELKECEGIIVFSDLAGGSPYKLAAIEAENHQNAKVLSGTNLPMLCEISMARTMIEDFETLVTMAINTGKDGIQVFEMPEFVNGPSEGEEGI